MEQYFITLDVGGTKIYGTLMNQDGKILESEKKKTKAAEGVDVVTQQIFKVVDQLIEKGDLSKDQIGALGAGVPGVIDVERGMILSAPNLPWQDYPFAELISERYGFAAFLDNDATTGMLGEWKYGAAKGKKDAVGLFIGTGVGGAIVAGGKIHQGASGAAGEIGHMIVNPEGPYCGCGARGCLEAYASKTALMKEIHAQLNRGRKSILSKLMKNEVMIKSSMIKKGLDEEDPLTIEIMERLIYYLGVGIGSLINVLSPEMVVIGGGVTESIGDWMIPRVKEQVKRFAMPDILSSTQIMASALGDNAINYGALALIHERTKKTK